MKIYLISTEEVKNHRDHVEKAIPFARLEKANAQIKENDQLLSLGASYLLVKYLPEKEIRYSQFGKPYIEDGPEFSLSHSGNYSVLAVATAPIGIDIEKQGRIIPTKIKERYFLNKYETEEEYLRSWCRKEAISKALGKGLSIDFSQIDDGEGIKGYFEHKLFVKNLTLFNHEIAVAIYSNTEVPIETILEVI